MKHQHNFRFFLLGVLTTLMIMSLTTPALALASKVIEVTTGVRIFIDDVELHPTDVNGNPVEAFIYNGATYLPVRAVSEALGKPVQWDGKNWSVYIGKHSDTAPAAYLSQMDYFSGSASISTAASDLDNAGNTHYYCITNFFDRTYKINGQYSRMTGTLYQRYEKRSADIYKNTGLTIYGDGKVLYTNVMSETISGFEPATFDIDLTGVLELQVVLFRGNSLLGSNCIAIGDVGLWT